MLAACRYAAKVVGPIVLALKWECQQRGAPHVHLCIPAGAMGERFTRELIARCERYGFGGVRDEGYISTGHLPAHYFAKYASKLDDPGDEIARREFIDYEQFLPMRVHFVSRLLTKRSGATIRDARLLRALWAFSEGFRERPPRFRDPFEEAHVYWHFRARRRGRESVPRSIILPDHGWDERFGIAPWCGEPVRAVAVAA